MSALEAKDKIEEALEAPGKTHINRRIGLLIAVLAALLALTEVGGKSAQTEALNANVQASDLWAFFQAKTIRQTILRTAAETAAIGLAGNPAPDANAAAQKQIDEWNATVARYESDPKTNEGRKELTERARKAEEERDYKLAAYHHFELASAAAQLAIVLASAAVITGIMIFAYSAVGLGIVSGVLGLLAWISPTAIHL